MKKFFKWTGVVIGSMLVLVLAFYTFVYLKTKNRFEKEYAVQVPTLVVPADSASIALGRHVATIKGCNDCHGPDYAGKVVIDDPGLGYITGPNITRGKGGLSRYSYLYQCRLRAGY